MEILEILEGLLAGLQILEGLLAGLQILEGLLAGLRAVCQKFPDDRRGKVDDSMVDIGLTAVSMLFLSRCCLSSAAWRKVTPLPIAAAVRNQSTIPSDKHIRNVLDQLLPDSFQPCFASGAGGNRPARGLKAIRATGRAGCDCA